MHLFILYSFSTDQRLCRQSVLDALRNQASLDRCTSDSGLWIARSGPERAGMSTAEGPGL